MFPTPWSGVVKILTDRRDQFVPRHKIEAPKAHSALLHVQMWNKDTSVVGTRTAVSNSGCFPRFDSEMSMRQATRAKLDSRCPAAIATQSLELKMQNTKLFETSTAFALQMWETAALL
jgi:hypothetical protein